MNKQTCENNIAVLQKIRDECKGQLDDGALSDLDQVIADLKTARDGGLNKAQAAKLALRSLQVIAVVVRLVTNISDWMK